MIIVGNNENDNDGDVDMKQEEKESKNDDNSNTNWNEELLAQKVDKVMAKLDLTQTLSVGYGDNSGEALVDYSIYDKIDMKEDTI
eukprot:CAMPEP_0201596720 /NCGR_PEP_ID=MMETSP0190_2-20130828/193349_1 /ASSEMBLY_ACC=CAM_ASM_000263 /TAXON_ID=37353 /ORGANISM="Rosalina sp." /LENGTH=84 /DNA_ID=CAMNT_0048057243 /DNA_START=907 /DNA_END=1162 /DNA_ORIENTATION=-